MKEQYSKPPVEVQRAQRDMSPAPVELYGWVLTDPMEGRTRHGAPMTNFVVETVNEETGELVPQRVTAFGAYAHDINDYIHEGLDLTLRGQHHFYEKDGIIQRTFRIKRFALGDKRERSKKLSER